MGTLTHSIIEWRRLKEECEEAKQQLREKGKKMKVLEEVILRIMKNHNIGALDLKNSGGRVLYKKAEASSWSWPEESRQTNVRRSTVRRKGDRTNEIYSGASRNSYEGIYRV